MRQDIQVLIEAMHHVWDNNSRLRRAVCRIYGYRTEHAFGNSRGARCLDNNAIMEKVSIFRSERAGPYYKHSGKEVEWLAFA